MKGFIQLQRRDPTDGGNAGGMYIKSTDISMLYYEREDNSCKIVLNNGLVYTAMQTLSEVMDEVTESLRNS